MANSGFVQNPVGLRPRGAHCGAFAGIENAELNTGFVGRQRHCAAHRIHFLDQMALADAANRRVATHLAQRFDVVRQQQCLATHACGRQRSLGASVAATYDDDVKFLGVVHRLLPVH